MLGEWGLEEESDLELITGVLRFGLGILIETVDLEEERREREREWR